MRSLFLLIAAGILQGVVSAQVRQAAPVLATVAFYNVENLFDTTDDDGVGDDEYLPGSARMWDDRRYGKKLRDIAGTLGSLSSGELPVLIGLAEIENRRVLEDLVEVAPLRRGGYGIVHFDSPDERGIDVALLYRREKFRVAEERSIPVNFLFAPDDKTRDILYVKGLMDDGNLYHLYINHWPSRSGTERESEMRRFAAAAALRKDIDNILNFENGARIIVLGDFNDEPTNHSIMQVLNATGKRFNHNYRDLYNLMFDAHNLRREGTIFFRDTWQMFDQIIVSFTLLTGNGGYSAGFDGGKVHSSEEILFKGENGVMSPNRTYGGTTYHGGVSDHLPVYLTLKRLKGE